MECATVVRRITQTIRYTALLDKKDGEPPNHWHNPLQAEVCQVRRRSARAHHRMRSNAVQIPASSLIQLASYPQQDMWSLGSALASLKWKWNWIDDPVGQDGKALQTISQETCHGILSVVVIVIQCNMYEDRIRVKSSLMMKSTKLYT